MPILLPSPTASLDVTRNACTPIGLWPPTPTPKVGPLSGETCALHSDVLCLPLLNASQYDNAPDQGLVPALLEIEGQCSDVPARTGSFLRQQRNQLVKVKNTFIDGFLDDEDQDDGPAVAGCKSWCAGFARQGSASWSCGSTSDGESLTAPSSPEGSARPGPSAEPPGPPPTPPMTSRAGEGASADLGPTWGSILHSTGRCRPCLFAERGCKNGELCQFCHMCTPADRRRASEEKKQRHFSWRSLRKATAAAKVRARG
jgi:hypothetical protein